MTDRFDATWESLQSVKIPDWFRDAKFGIWGALGTASSTDGR